ncbi:MAG: Sua5 YciO YrdC YwlC family protein [Campylobacterales bacterium]
MGLVYLAQTDTTVGFLSRNRGLLNRLKGRPENQPVLREVASLEILKEFTRVPKRFRREVRRRRQVTYLYPNWEALRVVDWGPHSNFLKKFGWLYSTSANPTGGSFSLQWAWERADLVLVDRRGLFDAPPSPIYRLGRRKKLKIR